MKIFLNSRLLIVILTSLACSMIACNEEPLNINSQSEPDIYIRNGRVHFKDMAIFTRTLDQIEKFKTQEEASKWETSYKYVSLRKYKLAHREETQEEEFDLPLSYSVLINERGEYAIGNTIIWFNKGFTHFIDNLDEEFLQKVKLNPSLSTNKYPIISRLIKSSTLGDARGRTSPIYGNATDARYQHEWLINTTAGGALTGDRRKTVYELKSYAISSGPTPEGYRTDYRLVIRLKLEWWWSGRGWQPNASEYRFYRYNISGSTSTPCGGGGGIFSFTTNGAYFYTDYDAEISLPSGYFIGGGSCNPQGYINYDIQGNIDTYVTTRGAVYQYTSPYEITGVLW